MKNASILILISFSALLVLSCDMPGSDERSTILEPLQPIFTTGTPTQAIGGNSEQMLAQTFTVQRDGYLTGIYLPLGCSDGVLDIEIRNVEDNLPGTVVLSESSYTADEIRSDVTVFELFRCPELSVEAGLKLSFV